MNRETINNVSQLDTGELKSLVLKGLGWWKAPDGYWVSPLKGKVTNAEIPDYCSSARTFWDLEETLLQEGWTISTDDKLDVVKMSAIEEESGEQITVTVNDEDSFKDHPWALAIARLFVLVRISYNYF